MKIKKVIVSGGTGFIGSYLVRRLVKSGVRVWVFGRSDKGRLDDIKDKFCYFCNEEDIKGVLTNNHIDVFFNLAASYFRDEVGSEQRNEMVLSNICLPSRLLNMCINSHVTGFVNTGSCFEYDLCKMPLSEKTVIKPFNYYSSTKVAFDSILKYEANCNHINAISLKLIYVFGATDNINKIVQLIIGSAISGKVVKLSDGNQLLNFNYVEDIVDAFILAGQKIVEKKYYGYDDFIIGNMKTYSIRQIASLIEKNLEIPVNIEWRQSMTHDIRILNCDSRKAKKVLGWKTKYTIERGICETVKYYKK